MEPLRLSVHPLYGAIYRDGEFVQRGAVLGLSVDTRYVVFAPLSGWVRLPTASETNAPASAGGLPVEIWPHPSDLDTASHPVDVPS